MKPHHRRATGVVAATLVLLGCIAGLAGTAAAATFDHERIISNDNMRDRGSMSAAQIQAFLETQTGPLKSLVTTDHAGVKRKASTIIWKACQAYSISPKVMLTMLQKEQSLLTRTTLRQNTLSRAIGAGCPNATTNHYPGFGNQMWHGTRLLDYYGERLGPSGVPLYYPGIARQDIYQKPKVTFHPKNIATYKLYVYNPSIGAKKPYGDLSAQASKCSGNANFWLIYRRYFGSTLASPRMRPVYRFVSKRNGTYLYTTSIAENHRLRTSASAKKWRYEGAAFSWDTSVTATSTVPVHRFYNKKTRKYSFTTSSAKYKARTSTAGRRTWTYGGVAFRVARKAASGSVTVYRFQNRKMGGYLLTASQKTVKTLRGEAKSRRLWRYEGVAFYLPRAASPTSSTAGSFSSQ